MFLNEVSLNVKPVFVNFSPFTTGTAPKVLPKEIVEKSVNEKMNIFSKLKGINLLEPYLVESEEDIINLGGELTKEVDFIIIQTVGSIYYDGWRLSVPTEARIGDYDVPLLKLATNVWDFESLEVVAALRSRGKKAYYGPSIEKMNKYLRIQQIKKALTKSKLLIFGGVHNRICRISESIMTNIYDPVLIKEKTGIEVEYYPIELLKEDIKEISDVEAKKVADNWLNGAISVRPLFRKDEVDEKWIINLAKLDIAIRRAIETQKATAVAGCEASMALLPNEATPCMTFTWLKDEGIPAVCEADINAGIPMIMLMYIAEAPADMGNILINTGAEHMMDFEVPNPDENTIAITHSVVPRKMKGFDTKPCEYEIIGTHCSTCYGANHVSKIDIGEMATISRMSPNADKILLAKGRVTNSVFTPAEGNRQVVYIDLGKSASNFLEEYASNFGNHLTYVFGDHIEETSKLCKELGIEPVIF